MALAQEGAIFEATWQHLLCMVALRLLLGLVKERSNLHKRGGGEQSYDWVLDMRF